MERASHKIRGPLHGIPFLVKDVGMMVSVLSVSFHEPFVLKLKFSEHGNKRQNADDSRIVKYGHLNLD